MLYMIKRGTDIMKIDFKKELQCYSAPKDRPVIVDVPEMNFVAVTGLGDPNTSKAYQDAVEALYAVAYTLKFMIKKGEGAVDYGVMPLEGLWWVEDMAQFSLSAKDDWQWTAMIMQPEYINEPLFKSALVAVKRKKNLAAIDKVEFTSFHEGMAAQIMHIGPYAEEAPTIANLHHYISEAGCQLKGKHHEIYLSDPRKAAPEKLRTIIRQPIYKG